MSKFYTPKELKEIIDHARAAGVQQIKIPGFEVIWPLAPAKSAPASTVRTGPPETFTPVAPAKVVVTQGVQKVPPRLCPGCNNPLKPTAKIGHLCVPCYSAKQRGARQTAPPVAAPPICNVHGMIMKAGQWGWYCHKCYVEDKKAKGLWHFGGGRR